MTKKSMARLQRDEAKERIENSLKTNTNWDDIVHLENTTRQLIASIIYVGNQSRHPDVIQNYVNSDIADRCMKLLAQDILRMSSNFEAIAAKHAGKKGNAPTQEEYMDSVGIYQEYCSLVEEIQSVVLPTVNQLNEEIGMAKERLQNNNTDSNLTPEQDPNVVTDVVLKD